MNRVGNPATVHPVAVDIADVPWDSRQVWAPDAAAKSGRCFLNFTAKKRFGEAARMIGHQLIAYSDLNVVNSMDRPNEVTPQPTYGSVGG